MVLPGLVSGHHVILVIPGDREPPEQVAAGDDPVADGRNRRPALGGGSSHAARCKPRLPRPR